MFQFDCNQNLISPELLMNTIDHFFPNQDINGAFFIRCLKELYYQ